MSYYGTPERQYYVMPPEGTPGWQFAPVPGWGKNPDRAGPPRVGVGGCACGPVGEDEDEDVEIEVEEEPDWGPVVIGVGAGLLVGLVLGHAAGKKSRARFVRPI